VRAVIVSFRLGGGDGVSVEARKWAWALGRIGFSVSGVAGGGTAERILPALGFDDRACGLARRMRATGELEACLTEALGDADLVVVENLCSLPLNPAAADCVARVLEGRPALLHHHDLPWQRERFAGHPPPRDDGAWCHVTVNDRSRRELAAHGIHAVTLYNAFDPDPPAGRRAPTRAALGLDEDAVLVLQPTRALARKRVGAAVALAERLGATYWLLGPAEDGYDAELERILTAASCPVLRGWPAAAAAGGVAPAAVEDAYAACDVVALPSSWEGFGNPALESATHRRPLFVGRYPVAEELAAFGFEWFFDDDDGGATRLAVFLERPDDRLLEHNAAVARRHFSLADLPRRLEEVLAGPPGGRTAPRRPASGPACRAAGSV
jgi:glycosyltransferase involved in cell wall biosynthesis